MTGMASTSMIPAGMSLFAMMVMVITMNIRVITKSSCKKSVYSFVSISADTTEKTDSDLGQGVLCATANAATDQGIYAVLYQKTSQRTVSISVSIYYLCACDFAIRYIVNLKSFCVSKVLKNFSIFISYCNFHK